MGTTLTIGIGGTDHAAKSLHPIDEVKYRPFERYNRKTLLLVLANYGKFIRIVKTAAGLETPFEDSPVFRSVGDQLCPEPREDNDKPGRKDP